MTADGLLDRALGCVLGLAVGDALGATLEFKTREAVRREGWLTEIRGGGWLDLAPGEVTDDTEMTLCVLQSYAAGYSLEDCAERFLGWYRSRPKDIGRLTRLALFELSRGAPPEDVGRLAWEGSGSSNAGNGAIMRCAPTALARRERAIRVRETLEVARVTHFDARCAESCLWLNAALAALLGGVGVGEALEAAEGELRWARTAFGLPAVPSPAHDVLAWVAAAEELTPESLDTSGYTLATAQVGAWALHAAENFEDGLVCVVNQGGDADTTGAVAGALLGARFGASAIPERWLAVLRPRDELTALTRRVLG